ncbi:MAG: hypothetical protein ACD_52C00118G0005 [uncultured bacterium]|nr:MAG: hypothetical protein ACD_52C00118G0005 [uncultured bacterium]
MHKALSKVISLVLGSAGFFILSSTLFPIFSYEVSLRDSFSDYLSPVPEKDSVVFERSVDDLTLASNWFDGGVKKDDFSQKSNISYYTLSIPKLKIANAVVSVGGEDLSQNLIQYPGTALPGKMGNTVIFGHSILPQFFNPKDYLSIFSRLPTLKKNDQIEIYFDGVSYLYRITDLVEVFPDNLNVLEQRWGDSFLSLITCVPPGDPRKPRRLVVRAKIIPPSERVDS